MEKSIVTLTIARYLEYHS